MVEIVKIVLTGVYYCMNVFLLIYGVYFLVTSVFAFKNNKKISNHEAKHKIAVLIPARNEENVIANLIDSLKKQNYPKELYDIFVIPNNCTDNTKQAALDAGANIIECKINSKSKGEVLKYTFGYMKDTYSDIDAYCIFDADNVVHCDFLSRMNDALCERIQSGTRV